MTRHQQPTILWLRNDLRLSDHAALVGAARRGPVLPVYVLDDEAAGPWKYGAASRWWLHHSLQRLAQDIAKTGGQLLLLRGSAAHQLAVLADRVDADAVYFSRAYEPWAVEQEKAVKDQLAQRLEVKRFAGRLLLEPERVATLDGRPYKVFTPFWKASVVQLNSRDPADGQGSRVVPKVIHWLKPPTDQPEHESEQLDDWRLLPTNPDWSTGFGPSWQPGEVGAHQRLGQFLEHGIDRYSQGRDLPAEDFTSRLSPHLHFGEISPDQVWRTTKMAVAANQVNEASAAAFLRELGWRDFSYHLLSHFPTLPVANFRPQFDQFPWREADQDLRAWQRGQTGYPLVDAGMRQLWHTGWMHNRVRMVVGSFLVKHLRLHWRHGEDWFWDTLVDADLANNSASWQWVAGSGADAAPYFRIFNPMTQGEKFDKDGGYIRHWVPELKNLPQKHLNKPWEAPAEVLAAAGVSLGQNYPLPIVDHRSAREAALAAFAQSKG